MCREARGTRGIVAAPKLTSSRALVAAGSSRSRGDVPGLSFTTQSSYLSRGTEPTPPLSHTNTHPQNRSHKRATHQHHITRVASLSPAGRASHHSLSTLFSLCLPFFFFSPFLSATCGRVTPAIHMTGERRCPSGHGRLARSCGVPLVPGRMNTAPPLVSLSPPPNTLSLPPQGQTPCTTRKHPTRGREGRATHTSVSAAPLLSQATRALSPAPTHSRVRLDR